MAKLFTDAFFTAIDSDGEVISGAKWNFYLTLTTTRHDTYTDNALSVAHANPVVADAAGRFAPIYLQDADYKAVLTDAADVVIKTIDPVHGGLDSQLFIDVKRDHGAKGDGSTDDRAAILAAIDAAGDAGGGIVWFPPVDIANGEYYRITKTINWRSNVHGWGAGPASHIRNDTTGGTAVNEHVFRFGLAQTLAFDITLTNYLVNDITANSRTITFDTAGDSAAFAVGDLICVGDGRRFVSNGRNLRFNYLVTRVTAVGSGTIDIEETPAVDYVTGSGAAADDSPRVWRLNEAVQISANEGNMFAVERSGLHNMALTADSTVGTVLYDGGFLECAFENLWTEGFASPVYGNLAAHSTWNNIFATVRNRGCEIKLGSHDCRITNLHVNYVAGGAPKNGIDIGEGSRNIVIDGWTINYNDELPPGNAAIDLKQGKNFKVTNGTLTLLATNANVVNIISGSSAPDPQPVEDIEVSHIEVVGTGTVGRYVNLEQETGQFVRRISLLHNKFFGSVVADAIRLGGSHHSIVGNYFENGRLNFTPASGDRMTQSVLSANRTVTSPNALTAADLLDNRISDHDSSGVAVIDSSKSSIAITADLTIPDTSMGGPTLTNEGATGTVTVTLPVALEGKRFRGYREATFAFRFDPNGSEQIRQNNGTLAAAGKYAEIGSDDGYLDLICLVNGIWYLTVEVGTINIEP